MKKLKTTQLVPITDLKKKKKNMPYLSQETTVAHKSFRPQADKLWFLLFSKLYRAYMTGQLVGLMKKPKSYFTTFLRVDKIEVIVSLIGGDFQI